MAVGSQVSEAKQQTRFILDTLREKYTAGEYDRHHPYAYFEELRVDTGTARRGKKSHKQLHTSKGEPRQDDYGRPLMKRVHHSAQAIDAFVMPMWPGKKYERIAYEVKVSRADFLNEIKMPWKRETAMAYSNRFIYITPPGLIKKDEIPEGCGLQEVHPSGHIRTVVKAPQRNVGIRTLPIKFAVSMMRQLNKS